MQARSLFIFVIAACGPRPPDDGATVGDTSSGATTTTGPAPTTGPATTTSSSSGATDDSGSAASVDPTIDKLDLPPPPDERPPPPPPACDPPPDVPPEAHCEVLQHDRGWDFFYACLEGADPLACPDATAAAVMDRLNDCSLCEAVSGDAMCGPDPSHPEACCYWGFGLVSRCPFP